MDLKATFTPEIKGRYQISYKNFRHTINLFHFLGTQKLNLVEGKEYNKTFIFNDGKEIEASGTAWFKDAGIQYIDHNYEIQYLELIVQKTSKIFYDLNIKHPNFLIKANGIDAGKSQIIARNGNKDEHDFSTTNVDGKLYLKVTPMLRDAISIDIRFGDYKILTVHLAPQKTVILESKRDSALYLEGTCNSSEIEWIFPNKSKRSIEEPMNRLIIRANDGFDGLTVVKCRNRPIMAWLVISLGTEDLTLNMTTNTAILTNAKRFLTQDKCYHKSLRIEMENTEIDAKDGFNCDSNTLKLVFKSFTLDLFKKSLSFPLNIEGRHVVNIRFV
ncbi:uncharacterized protein LOC135922476 [Gordionus sp. m RMFG-2023]|uniref:uncharacterized protein LOC135922476 n=1 Tax=Gordionus sp. m RMFG-2023 TaxID=3053472 RepID=UPI0031FC8FFC